MKITIVYDNNSLKDGLIADWGFACYIETDNRNILFDTGGNGRILLENLSSLNIDPGIFDDIVISHPDFDHIGGLSAILNKNSRAVVHVPVSLRGIRYPNEVKYYNKSTEIYHNIFLTGELANQEQSLALKTEKGLILIVGCSHPGLSNIIDSIICFGEIYMVIGGLHGFNEFELLEKVEYICPTHCTRYKNKIRNLYQEKYIEGGVGQVIEI